MRFPAEMKTSWILSESHQSLKKQKCHYHLQEIYVVSWSKEGSFGQIKCSKILCPGRTLLISLFRDKTIFKLNYLKKISKVFNCSPHDFMTTCSFCGGASWSFTYPSVGIKHSAPCRLRPINITKPRFCKDLYNRLV